MDKDQLIFEDALKLNDELHERYATAKGKEAEELLEQIAASEMLCILLKPESERGYNSLIDEE